MTDKKKNALVYGQIISKCWEDEAYKNRFLEDPEGLLSEEGFILDEGVTYKVVQQPKLVQYIVLPHTETQEAVQFIAKGLLNKAEQKDIIIPDGAEIRIIQNTDDTRYLILPASPKTLTQAELRAVAGGDSLVNATNVVSIGEAATVAVAVTAGTAATTYMVGAEVALTVVLVII